jgi:hypothetical protein
VSPKQQVRGLGQGVLTDEEDDSVEIEFDEQGFVQSQPSATAGWDNFITLDSSSTAFQARASHIEWYSMTRPTLFHLLIGG